MRHLRREDGAIELFVALALVAILGITALVVDIGNAKQTRRNFQTAADSGSLAGAEKLLVSPSAAAAETFAAHYAFDSMNQPRGAQGACPGSPYPAAPAGAVCYTSSAGAVVYATTPYTCPTTGATAGSGTCLAPAPAAAQTINVRVCQKLSTSFARVLKINSTMVCNSSTSTTSGATASNYALFAYNTSCSPLGIDGSGSNNGNIVGATHSNGSITVKNNWQMKGPVSYGGPNGCQFKQGNTTIPASTDPNVEPYPHDYTPELPTICPHMLSTDITFNGRPGTDISGNSGGGDQAYCTTGTITVGGNSLTCPTGCTMVGSNIIVTGNQDSFTPSYAPAGEPPLMFFATGTDPKNGYALDLSKNGASLTGAVFAPKGTINYSLNNSETAFIEGLNIILNQNNNAVLTGDGPLVNGAETGVTLVG